jgi:phospholipid/cholesterol/gamma-HCH transport system permease protein
LSSLKALGNQVLLAGQVATESRNGHWAHLAWAQAATIGWNTLWMGLLMATSFGAVIALQVAKEMVKQGAGQFVGALVSLAIVRELGPLMTGFSAIAIAGSAFTAEICTMRMTQQLDALSVMKVSAVRYLAVPRILSAVLVLPLVNILVTAGGIMGGFLVAIKYIPASQYFDSVQDQTSVSDLGFGALKTVVFALLFSVISVQTGLSSKDTSAEMVRLTTKAVVRSFIAMAIADYVISALAYN